MALPTPTPAQQIINNGNFLNDPSAEHVFTSFQKSKINFANIWKLLEQQGYQKEFLSLEGINTNQVETKYIADAIERGKSVGGSYGTPWTAPLGRRLLFMTITQSGQNDFGSGLPNTNISWEYRFYRIHRTGQIFGGNGGVIITSADVSPAGSFTIGAIEDNDNSDVYIDLGNIGGSNVWAKFNEGKPAPNLGDPWIISGLSLVTAIQNGTSKTWRFAGNQRLGIDTGEWGGDDITNPDYLAALQEDFDLLSNQPTVFPDLFITKSSRKYRIYALNGAVTNTLLLSPEYTTFNITVESGSGTISGFIGLTDPPIYDGADIFIKNTGATDAILKHNVGGVPFWFPTGFDLVVKQYEILHFKYNQQLNRVEPLLSGGSGGVNFTLDESLYMMAGVLGLNVTSTVENYIWTSGAQIFALSNNPTRISFIAVNGVLLMNPLTQWSLSGYEITILDELEVNDTIMISYENLINP